jgi:hypothetical protein
MFEFIGIVVVLWIVYIIIKALFTGKSMARGKKFGKEARYIAINELNVPVEYYNSAVINDIEEVKKAALQLKEQSDDHKNFSWPRLLAWTIYGSFRHTCEQYQLGNPVSQSELENLSISSDVIFKELDRNPSDLL